MDYLERYAELVVRVGLDFRGGQDLFVDCAVEHAPFARALARPGTAAEPATSTSTTRTSPSVRLGSHAPHDALDYTPPWLVERITRAGELGARWCRSAATLTRAYDDLDPARVALARDPELLTARLRTSSALRLVDRGLRPRGGWAQTVLGVPDVARLWEAVAHSVRLDEADPVAAWQAHVAMLEARTHALADLGLDAVRLRGPGTDLTVGLGAHSRWAHGLNETADGRRFVANLPTEDARRRTVIGPRARSARRSRSSSRHRGRGPELRFERGVVVDASPKASRSWPASSKRTRCRRLGELALVDGSSRVGRTGLTFFHTLYDENATCHIAYGHLPGPWTRPTPSRRTSSSRADQPVAAAHGFVGGPEVAVDGLLADGTEIPLSATTSGSSSRSLRRVAWERVDERVAYDGYRRLLARRYRLPDGSEREFEIKDEGPTAVVVALTPEQRVVLVREFRPGVEEELLELPGGLVDEGEEPAAAAAWELLEETGYRGEIVPLGSMVDCAYSTRSGTPSRRPTASAWAEPTTE